MTRNVPVLYVFGYRSDKKLAMFLPYCVQQINKQAIMLQISNYMYAFEISIRKYCDIGQEDVNKRTQMKERIHSFAYYKKMIQFQKNMKK